MDNNASSKDRTDLKRRLCLGVNCRKYINTCRNWRICRECNMRINASPSSYDKEDWGLKLYSPKIGIKGSRGDS